MRTLVQIYSATRWPLLAIAVLALYLCPLASGMFNVCIGIAVPLVMLLEQNAFPAKHYIHWSFLAIGLFAAVASLAIGAYSISQLLLGWFTDTRDPSLYGFAIFIAWVFAGSTVFQLLTMIPALEELRRDMEHNNGDIDI